jgi:hypothetical protein
VLRSRGIEPVVILDNFVGEEELLSGIPVRKPSSSINELDLIIIASISHSRAIEDQLSSYRGKGSPAILAAHQTGLGTIGR